MGRSFRVANLFGIPIKVDLSWVFIVLLLTSSLAVAYSHDFPYLSWPAWISMGLVGSLFLFGSVLAHELSHAFVAIRYRIPIRGITLFIFGGAAELVDEPPDPSAELSVAAAGPAMSLALAIGFSGIYTFGLGWLPASVMEIIRYLALMNGILVAFNLIPGFPLDGGRVLRALLWGIWGDMRLATRTASSVGSGFGLLIIFLGFVSILAFGNLLGGIWFVFIGLFLRSAARASYRQVLVRESLAGITVRELMDDKAPVVRPGLSLESLVHRVMLPTGATALPVVDDENLVGVVGLHEVRKVERSRWSDVTAAQIMRRDVSQSSISPNADAGRLLALAAGEDGLIPVVDEGRFVGVVTPQDVLRRVRLRMELREGLAPGPRHPSSAGVGEQGEAQAEEQDRQQDGQQRDPQ